MQETQTGKHDTAMTNKTGKQIQNSGPTDQLPNVRCTTSSEISNSKPDHNVVHSRTSQTKRERKEQDASQSPPIQSTSVPTN